MAVTREQWIAIWDAAGGTKAAAGVAPPASEPIQGRWISVLADRLAQFWSDHQDTLAPIFSQFVIATLSALISALPEILAVNRGGPG